MARSRLTKRQQKKLVRQTVLIVLAAILLLAGFIFLIVPLLVRLTGMVFDGGSILESDTIPPQPPVLASPTNATNSATLPISGVGEAGAKAVIVLNGERLADVEIDDEGEFKYRLPLTEGENKLTVFSVDEAENESVRTRDYLIELDTEAPMIEIESPAEGSTVELRRNQLTTIRGKTEPNARVSIDGRLVYANAEGNFSSTYELKEGENKIEIRATDRGGNESEKVLTVTFRP